MNATIETKFFSISASEKTLAFMLSAPAFFVSSSFSISAVCLKDNGRWLYIEHRIVFAVPDEDREDILHHRKKVEEQLAAYRHALEVKPI